MKTLIAVPCMDMVHSKFMESFMDSVEVKSRLGEGTRVKMKKTIDL